MRGGETKNLKREGKLGQGLVALKRCELEPPYELWVNHTLESIYHIYGRLYVCIYIVYDQFRKKCDIF